MKNRFEKSGILIVVLIFGLVLPSALFAAPRTGSRADTSRTSRMVESERTTRDTDEESMRTSSMSSAERLDGMVEKMEIRLVQLQDHIAAQDSTDEVLQQELIAQIDTELAWLGDVRTSIAIDETQDLRSLAGEVRERWVTIQTSLKQIEGRSLVGRVEAMLSSAQDVAAHLLGVQQALENERALSAELEVDFANYHDLIQTAEESLDEATLLYDAILSASNPDSSDGTAKQYLRAAYQNILAAKELAQQIVAEIQAL